MSIKTAESTLPSNLPVYEEYMRYRQYLIDILPHADKPERDDIEPSGDPWPRQPKTDDDGKPDGWAREARPRENGWVDIGVLSVRRNATLHGFTHTESGLSVPADTEYLGFHLRRTAQEDFTKQTVRDSLAGVSDYLRESDFGPEDHIAADTYTKLGRLAGRLGFDVIPVELPEGLAHEDPNVRPVLVHSTVAHFHELFGNPAFDQV